ncbi:MAG: type II toxin-antitoxin system RelE/ParE family toxin [Thermomicrobiales bacterium]
MSARKRRLTLRVDARFDLQETLLYSQQRWGEVRRRRYRAQLYKAMRSLLDYPESGRLRDELFFGCRGLVVEQHVIYYHVTDDEIIIGRVLHSSQDETRTIAL